MTRKSEGSTGTNLDPNRTAKKLDWLIDEMVSTAWRWAHAHGYDVEEIEAAMERAAELFNRQRRRGGPDGALPGGPEQPAPTLSSIAAKLDEDLARNLDEAWFPDDEPTPSAEELAAMVGLRPVRVA